MIQFLSQPWPWYIAGVPIGLTVPALLLLGNKSLFRILSPSQKRLIFRHFSPFFSYVAPAMRLQKRKNLQKISLFLPPAENPEQALKYSVFPPISATSVPPVFPPEFLSSNIIGKGSCGICFSWAVLLLVVLLLQQYWQIIRPW